MRKIFFILLAVLLSSCCKKSDCPFFNYIREITLQGFEGNSVLPVKVYFHTPLTDFSNPPVDSLIIEDEYTSYIYEGNGSIYLNKPLRLDHDYEFLIQGESFRISHFTSKIIYCGGCFLSPSQKVPMLVSYKLNSQTIEGANFTFQKQQ